MSERDLNRRLSLPHITPEQLEERANTAADEFISTITEFNRVHSFGIEPIMGDEELREEVLKLGRGHMLKNSVLIPRGRYGNWV